MKNCIDICWMQQKPKGFGLMCLQKVVHKYMEISPFSYLGMQLPFCKNLSKLLVVVELKLLICH